MASLDDAVSTLKGLVQNLSQVITTLNNVFPRTVGSFTMPAAATATVTQPAVKANSDVLLQATNASAATLMGSAKALYISTIAAGSSFTVATASGGNAAGTETFAYIVVSPS
jgi:hypothetical protein